MQTSKAGRASLALRSSRSLRGNQVLTHDILSPILGHFPSLCFFASSIFCCKICCGMHDWPKLITVYNGHPIFSDKRFDCNVFCQSSNGGTAWLTGPRFIPPHVPDSEKRESQCLSRRNASGDACLPPARCGGTSTPRGRVWFQENRRTCAGDHHIEANY